MAYSYTPMSYDAFKQQKIDYYGAGKTPGALISTQAYQDYLARAANQRPLTAFSGTNMNTGARQVMPAQMQTTSGTGSFVGARNTNKTFPNNIGATGTGTGAMTGGLQGFTPQAVMDSILKARPAFVQQQQDLLNKYGTSLRNSILHASPELAAASKYYNDRFADPFGGMEGEFQGRIRTAQAARGFGGGGTGPSGEEARYLQGLAEQTRQNLLPGMQNFGASVLGLSGLGPPDYSTGQFANLAGDIYAANLRNSQFQQQLGFEVGQYQDTYAANQQQSQIAQQYYNWLKTQLGSSLGGAQSGSGSGAAWADPYRNYSYATPFTFPGM